MEKLIAKNPFSGETVAEYLYLNNQTVAAKVQAAHLSQKKWSDLHLSKRIEAVKSSLDYFEEHRQEIGMDISRQMGRPAYQCNGEVNGFFERANYLCEIAESTLKGDIIESSDLFHRETQHVPLGVIFVISAWNYPLLVTVNSVIPALLAGNTILLKHSSRTPKIGEHFERAFNNMAGLESLLQFLPIDHKLTGRIIEEQDIDHIVFTGSVEGGRKILQHASRARKFLQPQLELGGKDGLYVHNDVNIQETAEAVVDGAMYNSGQSCCGIERVFVHKSIAEEFVATCKEILQNYTLGDPQLESTNLGPMCTPSSVKTALNQIKEAQAQGATVVFGGQPETIEKGEYLQPTLLSNVTTEMVVMHEENFAPILPICSVAGPEEAVEKINDSDYGLTAAIYTRDEGVARHFAEQIDCGTVFLNRCDYLDPALPWTGVKNSGCGSALSKYGFYSVTRRRAFHFRKPQ